jgi:hypothetical protein
MKNVCALLLVVSNLLAGSIALAASHSSDTRLGMWEMDMQNSDSSCMSNFSAVPGLNVTLENNALVATFSTGPVAQGVGLGAATREFTVSVSSGQDSLALQASAQGSEVIRYDGEWFDGNSAKGCVFKRVTQSDRQQNGDDSVCGSFPFFHSCEN